MSDTFCFSRRIINLDGNQVNLPGDIEGYLMTAQVQHAESLDPREFAFCEMIFGWEEIFSSTHAYGFHLDEDQFFNFAEKPSSLLFGNDIQLASQRYPKISRSNPISFFQEMIDGYIFAELAKRCSVQSSECVFLVPHGTGLAFPLAEKRQQGMLYLLSIFASQNFLAYLAGR